MPVCESPVIVARPGIPVSSMRSASAALAPARRPNAMRRMPVSPRRPAVRRNPPLTTGIMKAPTANPAASSSSKIPVPTSHFFV
jgi:hypothetical protein